MKTNKVDWTLVGLVSLSSVFFTAIGIAGVQPLGSDFDQNSGLAKYMDTNTIERVEARDSGSIKDNIARHVDRAGLRLIDAPLKMMLD